MTSLQRLLQRCAVHPEWRPILEDALAALPPGYLDSLLAQSGWLPGAERLLAAFRRDRRGLRYLLLGESPYPRAESANGIAFYDAAVGPLWSDTGLSKAVNRATSLRNLVKAALLAEGHVQRDGDGRITQRAIAEVDKSTLVRTLAELFENLEDAGFLMLNATPVLHPARKPAQEARYWREFLQRLLARISASAPAPVTLLLWGRIAAVIETLPASADFPALCCEHPYNVSFIANPEIQRLFADLGMLQRRRDDNP